MIPKDHQTESADLKPDPGAVKEITQFNESLEAAGVLKSVNGLAPPASGARIAFDGGRPIARRGPFADTNETLEGYWILELKSQQEAIDWALKCPALAGDTIEVRQIAGD